MGQEYVGAYCGSLLLFWKRRFEGAANNLWERLRFPSPVGRGSHLEDSRSGVVLEVLLLMEVLFCLSLSRDTISSFDRPLLRNMVALWIFYYVKREDRASLGLLVP